MASRAGELDLGILTAFLARCGVVVGNDSGPRHLAQALGTPTIGLYWAGNVINAGPLGRALHRLHVSWVTRCPVCGADVTQVGWTAERCPHDAPLMAEISSDAVHADVRALMAEEFSPSWQMSISRTSQPTGWDRTNRMARATFAGSFSRESSEGLYCSGRSSKNFVFMPPGIIAVTPISPAVSAARAWVKPSTPNLDAQYALASGSARFASVDAP